MRVVVEHLASIDFTREAMNLDTRPAKDSTGARRLATLRHTAVTESSRPFDWLLSPR